MTISKTERDALLAQFLNYYLFDQSEPLHGEEMTSLIMSAVDARVEAALVKALPVEEENLGTARVVRRKTCECFEPANAVDVGCPKHDPAPPQPDFAAMAEHLRRCPGDWEKILTLTKPPPAPVERDDRRDYAHLAQRLIHECGIDVGATTISKIGSWLRSTFAAPVAFDVGAAIKVVHEMQDAARAVLELGDIPPGAKGWLKDKCKAALEWLAVAKQMGVR